MVLRHVSILKDRPQGVCLYLAKVTELFKRFEEFFKFKTLNLKSRWLNPVLWQQYCSGCVVTLVVPCNAWHHKGHNTHLLQYCCHNAGINHRDFKFSVLNFKNS